MWELTPIDKRLIKFSRNIGVKTIIKEHLMDKKDFQKSRRDFIKKGLAGLAVLFTLSPFIRLEASINKIFMTFLLIPMLLNSAGFAKNSTDKKPNVIIIFTDDHRYTGVHALGNDQIGTPNIDELANNGVVFSNAYLMGSFSVATCMPSRAQLVTGRGVFGIQGKGEVIPAKHTTIGEAFQNAGYYSYIIGKWHQDQVSLARSFNDGARMACGQPLLGDNFRMPFLDWEPDGDYNIKDAYLLYYDENGKLSRRTISSNEKRGIFATEKDGPHASEVHADAAIDFISSYKKEKPFFMYLAFIAPHDPRQAPKKYHDMYPSDEIELPPSYMPEHPFDNGDQNVRDEHLAPWPRTPEIVRQHLADYYAIITHLDAQIGRVMEALKKNGMDKNTIILLTGDSGLAIGNHGLMGKQNIYNEDGIHVPLIISGTDLPKGVQCDALCYNYDIYPTLCDIAGIDIPSSVEGKSLEPVISGETKSVRESLYFAYLQYQRAYIKGDYKLIEYVKAKTGQESDEKKGSRVTQLFNIEEDPWETLNLSFFPKYEKLVREMQQEMKQEAVELGDNKAQRNNLIDFWDYFF